jgi:hypothetical protein
MARPGEDRVKAVWSGTGTGTMSLGGAAPDEPVKAFPASLDGQVVRYLIKHETAAEAESGYGVYTHSGATLTRAYRTYPTPGGSAVSFSSGTKFVAITPITNDFLPNLATSDPTVNDDITTGFLQGNVWINTATPSVWVCVSHTDGAAVWLRCDTGASSVIDQYDILARIASGSGAPSGLTAGDLTEESTPATGDYLLGWLADGTLVVYDIGNLPPSGGDVEPSQVASDAAEYVLLAASRLHNNVEVRSHAANVDFEVPTNAAPGSKWLIYFDHDGCTVSVDTNAGSINGTGGGAARGVNGGLAIAEVKSNAGTAPVVLVRGDVLIAPTDVGTTKTYDNDDAGQDFRLTSTSTQTFSAAANYSAGFYCNLFKETTGNVTIDGVDRDYTMTPTAAEPSTVTIKKIGTALIAFGSDGTVGLDDA